MAVVDEAAQCVEPSLLIALRRGCRQCVMVGDPNQLPATIFSDRARRAGFDRSLFERLMSAGHRYVMLDTQYRMTPHISSFPSLAFYGGMLKVRYHRMCVYVGVCVRACLYRRGCVYINVCVREGTSA